MAGIPDHILRRSAEARAKAEGRTVDEVLAEMKGEAPPAPQTAAPESPQPVAEQSATAAAPVADAVPAPAPAAGAAAASTAQAMDLETQSADLGVPVDLLRRAALARAKASGVAPPAFAGEASSPAAAAAGAAAPAAAPPAAAAVAAAVFQATGLFIPELPVTPERIFEARKGDSLDAPG